ncbi:MAG TPA: TetR/AcrR family transcriptional regulator [Nevskiales bacterium]|nr:TetR/AcrR family transcriptional regulator [Nevskiales bacterium]
MSDLTLVRTKSTALKPRPRPPGRPKASAAQRAENEELVLAAAEVVYARHSYHEITVEQILVEAGISRPTFYRWFSGKDEVLERVVQRANDALLARMNASMSQAEDLMGRIAAGVDAYIQWGLDTGPVVLALYREAHLPGSPVHKDRRRVGEGTLRLYMDQVQKLGRPVAHPLLYQSIIAAILHAGSWLFSKQAPTEQEIRLARQVMLRIAQSALAEGRERSAVPPQPV